MAPIYFTSGMEKSTMEVIGAHQLLGYQNIFFCVQQKKEIHTGLEQLEGHKIMTEFSYFGKNIPLSIQQNKFKSYSTKA